MIVDGVEFRSAVVSMSLSLSRTLPVMSTTLSSETAFESSAEMVLSPTWVTVKDSAVESEELTESPTL